MITATSTLEQVKQLGSKCERSNHCCRYGSGFVLEEDILKLAAHLRTTTEIVKQHCLEEVAPFGKKIWRTKLIRDNKPYGTCLFFHPSIGCTVHQTKPLHCQIGNCSENGEQLSQWYFMQHIIDKKDPSSIASWKEYLAEHKPILGADPNEWRK